MWGWIGNGSFAAWARFLKTSEPTSVAGIEKYLASGMIRGIGPTYAKKLLRAFGEKVFEVIEGESMSWRNSRSRENVTRVVLTRRITDQAIDTRKFSQERAWL